MVGTACPAPPRGAETGDGTPEPATPLRPPFIATIAEGISWALAYGRPECAPTPEKQLRVRLPDDHGHCRASGQPGHEDAACVHVVTRCDFADDSGNQRRFSGVTHLILRLEPVPALRHVRVGGLLRIDHQEPMLFQRDGSFAYRLRSRLQIGYSHATSRPWAAFSSTWIGTYSL